jgi:hypothetical protein
VAFKPTVALVPFTVTLVWMASGRLAKAARTAAGGVSAVALAIAWSSLLIPQASWQQWWAITPELVSSTHAVASNNISVARLLRDHVGEGASLALPAVLIALFVAAALRARPSRAALDEAGLATRTLLATGAGTLTLLLSSRLVWSHYVLLAVPSALYVLRSSMLARGPRCWLGVLALFPLTTGAYLLATSVADRYTALFVTQNAALVALLVWTLSALWNQAAERDAGGASALGPPTG